MTRTERLALAAQIAAEPNRQCKRCGLCCTTGGCSLLDAETRRKGGTCQHLQRAADIYSCGLYLAADDAGKAVIAKAQSFGVGCTFAGGGGLGASQCRDCEPVVYTPEERAHARERKDMRIGVVIAALNEPELPNTIASIRADSPQIRDIYVVDDCSDKPLDVPEGVHYMRNAKRIGAGRSKARGMKRAAEDGCDPIVTADSHQWFHAPDCEMRYRQWVESTGKPLDPNVLRGMEQPDKLGQICRLAHDRNCIAYMPGNAHWWCSLTDVKGIYRVQWRGRAGFGVVETAGIINAVYAFPRAILEQIGGYPQLPGHCGSEEEAIAHIAAGHQIPILCDTNLQSWHLYQPHRPFVLALDQYRVTIAAVLRLAFDDAHWAEYRKLLVSRHDIPLHVVRSLDQPAFTEYTMAIRSRFKLDSEGVLAELARRVEADTVREAQA